MKKIIERAFFIISILLFFNVCYCKVVYGEFLILGYKPFIVMSGSMEPTISTYQVVLGEPIRSGAIDVGDIAAYELYAESTSLIKETVIHRVKAIDEDGKYIFKGDNNEHEDQRPIEKGRIKYKIVIY